MNAKYLKFFGVSSILLLLVVLSGYFRQYWTFSLWRFLSVLILSSIVYLGFFFVGKVKRSKFLMISSLLVLISFLVYNFMHFIFLGDSSLMIPSVSYSAIILNVFLFIMGSSLFYINELSLSKTLGIFLVLSSVATIFNYSGVIIGYSRSLLAVAMVSAWIAALSNLITLILQGFFFIKTSKSLEENQIPQDSQELSSNFSQKGK